ncbi:MAG: Unknown protein [uncultured Sulfurovum sp.]|uniref:Uncharacterized protein n=1 Tax=uncultured Sulfurovum sp. TaxID=269237 RepID=A0A6S6T9P1_9BACT|nr:MAG: Unknown protein [uncultured Sulfurovum sp.]
MIKNIVLSLNAIVLIMTLSIVVLPHLWMISVVTTEQGLQGAVIPHTWTVYAVSVFITAGFTFSWLIKGGK